MQAEDKQAFVHELAVEHGARLRRFLGARLRRTAAGDVPDLVQEIYLRVLRVPSVQTIRSPRAYLFTVALHVLHQHELDLASVPESVDIASVLEELETRNGENPAVQAQVEEELRRFERVLAELAPVRYAVFVLHRKYGFSREEIADRLGLSVAMVKKHLGRALVHCRKRLAELE